MDFGCMYYAFGKLQAGKTGIWSRLRIAFSSRAKFETFLILKGIHKLRRGRALVQSRRKSVGEAPEVFRTAIRQPRNALCALPKTIPASSRGGVCSLSTLFVGTLV